MIKLSDRLQLMADKIQQGETMADIGTDHGFLPIYLKLSGKSPKVILADISLPSLDKARANVQAFAPEEPDIDFRAGDGLSVMEAREVNSVVIAGMGGKLIRDIMAKDTEHTCSFDKFILQPRIGQGHLRKWLVENGFKIISEDVVTEGSYIPEIITVISPYCDGFEEFENLGFNMHSGLDGDSIEWKIPPWIIKGGGPVGDFLNRNIFLEEEKLSNVKKAKERNFLLEDRLNKDIEYIKTLRKEWFDGKKTD